MRIRTRLSLFSLAITVLTAAAMMVLAEAMVRGLAEDNLTSALDSVADLAESNYRLSEKILTSYGEKTVELQCNEVAAALALMLGGKSRFDYDELRKDPEIRKIATQDVFSPEGVAGYVDVYDNKGVSVWHPNKSVEGRNFAEWNDEFPDMWKLVKRSFTENIVKGYYRFIDRKNRARMKYMVLVQVPGTPFIACTVVNIDQYFLPLHERMRQAQEKAMERARASIRQSTESTLGNVTRTGIIGGAALLALIGCFGVWFAGSLAGPIMRLRKGVRQIGEGNFQAEVEERGSDEVKQLARTFNQLGKQLTQYMDNLREAVASKERIDSELAIAAEIQRSMIPSTFSPFPDHGRFEIYGLTIPARQVGGDFYDFFFVDEHDLCFTICDVSGKGIPAAIFMAVTRSLIEAAAKDQLPPDRLLDRVNRQLLSGNDTYMFSTAFLGILNLKTGSLDYANGGHNPPLLIRGANSVEFLGPPGGPVLGLFEEKAFPMSSLVLDDGDELFTFTDGVTEAMNEQEHFFSKERLMESVSRRAGAPVRDLVEGVLRDINTFARDAPQADDITMLAMKFVR